MLTCLASTTASFVDINRANTHARIWLHARHACTHILRIHLHNCLDRYSKTYTHCKCTYTCIHVYVYTHMYMGILITMHIFRYIYTYVHTYIRT